MVKWGPISGHRRRRVCWVARVDCMTVDPFEELKQVQKLGWVHFVSFEAIYTSEAAKLVRHAGVRAGQRVLDAGCGTGLVAITAARAGAKAVGVDFTPELLE